MGDEAACSGDQLPCGGDKNRIGSLSSDVFERRTSTGKARFALLSRDFEQVFGQIVSVRIKTLGNINTVASRLIKRGKGSLPLDVRRSKTSLLKLPNGKCPTPGDLPQSTLSDKTAEVRWIFTVA